MNEKTFTFYPGYRILGVARSRHNIADSAPERDNMTLKELVATSRENGCCDYCSLPLETGQKTIVLKTGSILTPVSDRIEMEVKGVHVYHVSCVLKKHATLKQEQV